MFSGSAHSLQPSPDDICSDIARLLFLGLCILFLCHFSKMTLAVLPFTVTWPVLFYTHIPTLICFRHQFFELSLCSDCISLNTLLWWQLMVTTVGTLPATILAAPHMLFATRPSYSAAVRNTDDAHACHYTSYLQYYLHEALFAQYASRRSIMGMSACLSLERLMIPICY